MTKVKTSFAHEQLKSIVERIERLETDRKTIGLDIREMFVEAKGNGFCTKTLRKIIALRKKDASERSDEQAMLDLYLNAMGMQSSFDFADEQPAMEAA
jgi:uncharacterized protein (UPF0335 family)